eukprot:GFUD01081822.1.p1 GENE.GFUD01081822.1~~GFUD01081822.1.p1  ORF type:complete len:411 (+),score=74.95 GFUD01081822.1:368-1600(+)
MPTTSKNTKIYKLKPTDGPLNRDDLSTWIFTVKSFCRQNDWSKFLPGGANATWTSTDDDETNALNILKTDGSNDAAETTKLRESFQDFLTAVAANCPTGFTSTVVREATSFAWIEEKIKKTFNLTTKGENFLDGLNLKFEFDDSFTYQQAWMTIKDKYISSLLPAQSKYMGKTLTSKEIISPLAMNFLVREWLLKIDSRLPDHVRTSRGHLFTNERPTLACNQQILCDQIDIMLQELDGKDTSTNNINVGYVPSNRGRQGARPRQSFYSPSYRPSFRQRGGSQRFSTPGRRPTYSCYKCLEARPPRYDSSITHAADNCPFPTGPRNQARQQPRTPQFKVLFVPTQKQDDVSVSVPAPMADTLAAPPSHYYPDQEQFYQEQVPYDTEYQHYDDQYYDPSGYETGTIQDLPL